MVLGDYYVDMTPFEEFCADRIDWIGLRAKDLICDGFHRDNALRMAQWEWEDGNTENVDLTNLDEVV